MSKGKHSGAPALRLLIITAVSITAAVMNTAMDAADEFPAFRPGDKILFQGDSITDAGRTRAPDPAAGLGEGYVSIIAARATALYPGRRLAFVNRGISGDKAYQLASRWQADTIDLKPNVLSILVGINDTAAEVPLGEYEASYQKLLAQTVAALPGTRLVLGEPFTVAAGVYKNDFEPWRAAVAQSARIVKQLAAKYRAVFVRFQQLFDDACKRAPAEDWSSDGIHPTHAAHQIMADEWVRAVDAFSESQARGVVLPVNE